jgi:hypothetical protein
LRHQGGILAHTSEHMPLRSNFV